MIKAEWQERHIARLQKLWKRVNMVNYIGSHINPRKICQIFVLSGIAFLLVFGHAGGNHYGLELGYVDPHNPKNNYFYDIIINRSVKNE